MAEYRDSSGRTLTDYPRPSVAVDTAVLTVTPDGFLAVVLAGEGRGQRRLPGTFLHERERLSDAVLRSLRTKVGIEGLQPEQLRVFDNPRRDPRGWVLSVAHVDVVPFRDLSAVTAGHVVPVDDAGHLLYDHDDVLRIAVEWLRSQYLDMPDPRRLLGETFTLRDLQHLHEAVAGHPWMRDTFRRKMERRLRETGRLTSGVVGKPARLWVRED